MASVSKSSLEIGLAALKQGDYPAAIAHLETVCQTPANQSAQVRAQMGLVVAWARTGEISRAITLCQTLSQSTNPQVREWALRNQAELTNGYTAAQAAGSTPDSDLTGFVAFERPPSQGKQSEDSAALLPSSRPVPTTCVPTNPSNLPKVNPAAPPSSPERVATGRTPVVSTQPSARKRQSSEVPSHPSTSESSVLSSHSFHWRQAGRAKRWQPLSAVNLTPLLLLQVGTAIALFWLLSELLKLAMAFTNDLLVKLPYLEPFQPFYRDPTQEVLLTLGILMSLSPWLLDGLLRLLDGLQPLSINTLSTHSPEAIRVLQRYCRQRRWPLPQLGILPTSAPLALSYGNLPRTARIVVSQGLLEQLKDDEIATIYAAQLGHIAHWDFAVMSLVILVTHLPYTAYRQVSQWGDRISNRILGGGAAAIASLAYGVWCFLGGPALWLSHFRLYYSDRHAAEITGNPNGLTRALLKIAQGIAKDIQQQGHTSWLLESLNLLIPVGYRQAITLGSLHPCTQLEPVLAWDCLNPYRHWLTINNTHPLMGERLQRLARIAQHWHLETELGELGKRGKSVHTDSLYKSPPASPAFSAFLLQSAPFFGITVGFALGGLTWLIGGIGILLRNAQLAWMYGDWLLIKGYLPIGFSIGTFVRINSLFPDIKPSTVQTDTSLPHLLAKPAALPVDSQPLRLQGKLLGRRGISNWLGQDLILDSPTGLVKLHHVSWLGPVGNLLPRQSRSPRDLVGQHLIATGWFRRGATSWIDIDTLRTQSGKTSCSGHPLWSTLLASAAAAWGAYIILWGKA